MQQGFIDFRLLIYLFVLLGHLGDQGQDPLYYSSYNTEWEPTSEFKTNDMWVETIKRQKEDFDQCKNQEPQNTTSHICCRYLRKGKFKGISQKSSEKEN